MATIDTYKIKVEVDGQGAVKQLTNDAENAEKAFDELGNKVDKVGKVVATSFALIAGSALRMADGLMDVADATGLSVGVVGALAESVEAAGGKFDDVGKIVNTFYKNLEDSANNQGGKAAESLRKLGIGLTELQTLSEQELLTKALDQLSQMEAGAARTALGVEIFGKAFATIDPEKLKQIFASKDVNALNKELQAGADFIGAMEQNFRTLQRAALSALEPIIGEVKDLRLSAEQANTIIKTLGIAIATIYGAKTIMGIAQFIKLMQDLNVILKAQALLQATIAALSGPAGWARAAGAVALVAGAAYGLNKLLEDNVEQVKELNTEAEKTAGAFADATGFSEEQVKKQEQELKAAKEITRQMQVRNGEANKYQRIINDTIGKTEEEANLIKALVDIEKSAGNEKLNIQKQIDAELAKGNETNKAVLVELKNQLDEIDKQLVIQKQLKSEELARLQQQKDLTLEIQRQGSVEQFNLDVRSQATKDNLLQEKLRGELTQRQFEIASQLAEAELKFEQTRIKLAEQRLSLGTAISEQQIKNLNTLESLNQIRYNNELSRIAYLQAIETNRIKDYTAASLDAVAQIAKSFEPYKMAQDAVLQTWNRIGSAVDEFIENGKFRFKDFARSIILDLTKMIAKAMIFRAIAMAFGGFGISIPGLAAGGPAKAGQPYIVGEKGPELFVPKSAGTVIPNNKLGATEGTATGTVNAPVTNTYNTYNISAIDSKSVAQFFYENRKTMFGTMTMARKELPYAVG